MFCPHGELYSDWAGGRGWLQPINQPAGMRGVALGSQESQSQAARLTRVSLYVAEARCVTYGEDKPAL